MSLKIREVLKEKGVSIQELADSLGVSLSATNQYMSGNPTIETLQKIADALSVHISELFNSPNDNQFRCPKCGTTLEITEKVSINV